MFFRSGLKRRKKRRGQVQPEALEARTMLAGDVSAILRGDTLMLQGDSTDNAVEVRPNDDGDVTVFPVGDTLVNGSADPFVVTEGTELGGVKAKMKSGDDLVRIESVEISGNVVFIGRRGDDAFGLYDSVVSGNAYIFTGSGNDSVSIDEVDLVAGQRHGGALVIGTGRGDDTVGVDASTVEGSTSIFTWSGEDRVAVRDSQHENVTIGTGFGDDFVSIEGASIQGRVYGFTSFGDDEVAISESEFGGRTTLFGGWGRDRVDVSETDFARDPRLYSISADSIDDSAERTDAVFLDLVRSGARLGTIAELAIITPDLSTLVQAVVAANLVDTLNGTTPLTVFAPTNDAFANLPDGTLDDLLADPGGALTDILTYHVSPGAQDAADVVAGDTVDTVNGATIAVSVTDDGVFLNETTQVIVTDIRAKNGFVHLIDEVLMPPADG